MNKTILCILLSLVLVTLTCTCAYATEEGSGQADETYTIDPTDYSNYFLMLNRSIDYQSLNCTYAIPMKAGDSLYVNVTMSSNATYQCLDPIGLALLLEGNMSEENLNQILNHTLLNFSVVNSSSYEAYATAPEDTWFCLVVWPEDVTQLPTGNIRAVRFSQSEEDIGLGFNGSEFLDYCYVSLPQEQQIEHPENNGVAWTPDTSTLTEDGSYDDEIPWVPDMSVDDTYYSDGGMSWGPDIPDYSSYSSSTDEYNLGPITGPDLSSTSIDSQDIDLGLATGIPFTGPTGEYTPYYSSAYSSIYLNEAFQEQQDRIHEIDMKNAEDRGTYFQWSTK